MADLTYDPNTPLKPRPIASFPFWIGTDAHVNAALAVVTNLPLVWSPSPDMPLSLLNLRRLLDQLL